MFLGYPNTLMFETVRNITILEQSRHLWIIIRNAEIGKYKKLFISMPDKHSIVGKLHRAFSSFKSWLARM